MRFTKELTYHADPGQVFAMLADPAFREKVARAQEVVSVDVRLTPSGEGFTMRMEQVQDTRDLPAIAKKITGDTTQAVIAEDWPSTTDGSIEITAPGKPTTATGTITLTPDGAGTRESVELDVRVKVPLIGGKLEKLMAEKVRNGMDAEQTVGVEWLGSTR